MWFYHFLNLCGRSWNATTAGYGTTTLGFILWVVVFTALLWCAGVLATWLNLRKAKTQRPFKEVLRDSLLTGVLSAACIGLIVVASYSYFFVRSTYRDHQSLVRRVAILSKANSDLTGQLEIRKHTMVGGDPVFTNTIYLLQAFNIYRHAQNGKPCVLMLTAPPADSSLLPSMVAQFSNSVSGCFTFGPMDSSIDPDVKKRAMDGMVPNKIVFHAARDDKAAYQLFTALENLIQLQRSYDLPSATERTRIYSIPKPGQEDFVWLQFGTNVRWN